MRATESGAEEVRQLVVFSDSPLRQRTPVPKAAIRTRVNIRVITVGGLEGESASFALGE